MKSRDEVGGGLLACLSRPQAGQARGNKVRGASWEGHKDGKRVQCINPTTPRAPR